MTPKTAGPSVKWLVLGAALLLAPAARAQSAAPDLASSMTELSAKIAQGVAAQKALAAQRVASADVPVMLTAPRTKPDPTFTPGHLCSSSDPNFKEYRYPERIPYCNRNVTQQMKLTVAQHYGVPEATWNGYEFDHLIPLAIGGDSSVDNLWPQPHGSPDGSGGKDALENTLYSEMAAGTVTQAEAVRQIYAWFTAAGMAAQATEIAAR